MWTGIWISTKPKSDANSHFEAQGETEMPSKQIKFEAEGKKSMPLLVWNVFLLFFMLPSMLMVRIIVYFINLLLFNLVLLPQTNEFFLSRYYVQPEMAWITKTEKYNHDDDDDDEMRQEKRMQPHCFVTRILNNRLVFRKSNVIKRFNVLPYEAYKSAEYIYSFTCSPFSN